MKLILLPDYGYVTVVDGDFVKYRNLKYVGRCREKRTNIAYDVWMDDVNGYYASVSVY